MTTSVRKTTHAWMVAAVVAFSAVTGSAQQATGLVGAQAQTTSTYVVGQAKPPIEAGGRLMDLSLDQAMVMALEKNLDLKVARMNPQGVDYQLQAARAAFNPQLTGTY